MKTIRELKDTVTSHGNILRGIVQVKGEEYTIESDGVTWVSIINSNCSCESCKIDGEDVISSSGEYVTESWTDRNWKELNKFVLEEVK